MTRVSPDTLARSLDDLRDRRVTLDECLIRHPDEADDLRELVEITRAIAPPPSVHLDPSFRWQARSALLAELAATRRPSTRTRFFWTNWTRLDGWLRGLTRDFRALGAPVALAVVALLVPIALGGGVVFAAESALPGDPLYSIKLAMEYVPVAIALTDEARANAYVALAAERLAEMQQAQQRGRGDALAAAGTAYVADLTAAEKYLGDISTSDQAAHDVTTRLAENLANQQNALATAVVNAPVPARATLAGAEAAAKRGLDVASAHLDDEIRGALPSSGAIPIDRSRSEAPSTKDRAAPPQSTPDSGKPTVQPIAKAAATPARSLATPPKPPLIANNADVGGPSSGAGKPSDHTRDGRADPPPKHDEATTPHGGVTPPDHATGHTSAHVGGNDKVRRGVGAARASD